ncbi:MAG: hypothetical protein OXF74_02615 [Rhodobacteraceae bacterium]|nr:hypothetical protein [Paracoccaceae bacterium]
MWKYTDLRRARAYLAEITGVLGDPHRQPRSEREMIAVWILYGETELRIDEIADLFGIDTDRALRALRYAGALFAPPVPADRAESLARTVEALRSRRSAMMHGALS